MTTNSAMFAEVASSVASGVSGASSTPRAAMRVDKVISLAAGFRQRATVGLGVLLGAEASSVMFGATRVAACDSGGAVVGDAASASANDTGGAKPDGDSDEDKLIDIIVESFTKVAGKLGFGGVLGFCTGYAAKQVTKAVAVVVGVLFVVLQTLAHYGFIDVKWDQVKAKIVKVFDVDGDGKFNAADAKTILKGSFSVLKAKLPEASSFVPGFYYGFFF